MANSFKEAKASSTSPSRARIFLGLVLLATLLAYSRVLDNHFVDWDDSSHVFGNPIIRHLDFSGFRQIFTHFNVGNYIPLTWLSLALDFQIGRLEPWVYHLHNLLLHCLNTSLVFSLSLRLLTLIQKKPGFERVREAAQWPLWSAFGATILFALHPMRVDSVAWASERKDVLYGLFYLASLWLYLDYALSAKPVAKKYWICLGLFIAAILSKPMAVSLPLVFLLLDFWPLNRFQTQGRKIFLEKIPFGVTILAFVTIVVSSQFQSGAGVTLKMFPPLARLANAGHSVIFYLWNMVFPLRLTAYYPLRLEEVFSAKYLVASFLALIVSFLFFRFRRKTPYLLTAWLFYLVNLAPVLGFVQVGNQGAADRFTYLAAWGPFLLAASALTSLFHRKPKFLILCAVLVTILLGAATQRQVSFWKDNLALWENVHRCYPTTNFIAYHNRGSAYENAGRWEEAYTDYSIAIQINPYFVNAYWGKAKVFAAQGFLDDSIAEYRVALQITPKVAPIHSGLSEVYQKKGMGPEALAEAEQAVQLDPHYPEAYRQLGMVYLDQARPREAQEVFEKARALDPDNPVHTRNLITAFKRMGNHQEALALYQEIANHPRSLLSMNF